MSRLYTRLYTTGTRWRQTGERRLNELERMWNVAARDATLHNVIDWRPHPTTGAVAPVTLADQLMLAASWAQWQSRMGRTLIFFSRMVP